MKNRSLFSKTFVLLALILPLANCATNISKPKTNPQDSKVKFGVFKKVELKEVVLNKEFSNSSANKRALKKINQLLENQIKSIFPNITLLKEEQSFSSNIDTLQITPVIKEIKFVGVGGRLLFGALAGSSAILMEVTYSSGPNRVILASPEFYKSAGAYSGGFTIGVTDNQMLDNIVTDIANYTSSNK